MQFPDWIILLVQSVWFTKTCFEVVTSNETFILSSTDENTEVQAKPDNQTKSSIAWRLAHSIFTWFVYHAGSKTFHVCVHYCDRVLFRIGWLHEADHISFNGKHHKSPPSIFFSENEWRLSSFSTIFTCTPHLHCFLSTDRCLRYIFLRYKEFLSSASSLRHPDAAQPKLPYIFLHERTSYTFISDCVCQKRALHVHHQSAFPPVRYSGLTTTKKKT